MKQFILISVIFFSFLAVEAASMPILEDGVSYDLAQYRSKFYSNVKYNLNFNVPLNKDSVVLGNIEIIFELEEDCPIVIDFQSSEDKLMGLKLNNNIANYIFDKEHIVVKDSRKGLNIVQISFISNDKPLNRNIDYLYTLLVPDRARTLFPCFDQPDIKAKFNLTLSLPNNWKAVANSPELSKTNHNGYSTISFQETEPLSTYLFSFVAGKFEKVVKSDGVHTISAYYRETDLNKVKQLDKIFEEVFHSLKWMEDYTGISYPFAKYDFIILPGFQFGGMEHTGATLYNDKRMFLSDNPTQDELIGRSQVIAHETSHMWFGDLVTMKWFNDVWTKEVFANYFAAKISENLYPGFDGSFSFIRDYTMSALAQDRTDGATPIQQKLDNMNNAGLVYNNIIYCKSPIVMLKIHELIGEESFRKSIQDYLKTYSYSNASWDDLIDIFAKYTSFDINQFSQSWVKEIALPVIEFTTSSHDIKVRQNNLHGNNFVLPQSFKIGIVSPDEAVQEIELNLTDTISVIDLNTAPKYIIPNIDGRGYGIFITDDNSTKYMLKEWPNFETDVNRQTVLINLYENWSIGKVEPFESFVKNIVKEVNPLIQLSACNYAISMALFKEGLDRMEAERTLLNLTSTNINDAAKLTLLRGLFSIMSDEYVVSNIFDLWHNKSNALLSERDYMTMAYHLAILMPESSDYILKEQLSRIENVDRKNEFIFISRACTNNAETLDILFDSLKIPQNRLAEPWTATLISLINHHSREEYTRKYIYPALEELTNVQKTGDIFFPANWVSSLMYYHQNSAAIEIVQKFLNEHQNLNPMLKSKILQSYKRN